MKKKGKGSYRTSRRGVNSNVGNNPAAMNISLLPHGWAVSFSSGDHSHLQRTLSQGGPDGVPMLNNCVRSTHGKNCGEHKMADQQQDRYGQSQSSTGQNPALDAVTPLQFSANRWDRKSLAVTDPNSPKIVDRKVKSLLNKLTIENFDPISDQIIAWANKSKKEKDGRTLIQVIKLMSEKVTDKEMWSEMSAQLCHKIMERISPQVQDNDIKNAEGKPITCGQLFHKHLLNRCQKNFECHWAKEIAVAAAAIRALKDQAMKATNKKGKGSGGIVLPCYSDKHYAAQKAKHQCIGLIKFIGELFKL